MEQIGIYIELFHGRKTVEENLEDWGTQGPVLGPFEDIIITYASHVKCAYAGGSKLVWLNFNDDLLEFDGVYYGDFAIFTGKQVGTEVHKINGDLKREVIPVQAVPEKYHA